MFIWWQYLGSATILGVHIIQMLQMYPLPEEMEWEIAGPENIQHNEMEW